MFEPPRIVTWRAVSTDAQVDRESLHHQTELNKQHVAKVGGIVVAELSVDGESRNIDFWEDAVNSLEAFRTLDELLRRRPAPFDIFMCYDLTRVARTDSLAINFAKKCERAGVRIYECMSPPARLDGPISTPESRFMMLFKAHQSEQEVRKFTERASFGRQARVRKGKHAGNPPYGYKRVYDELGVSFAIIDEEKAEAVRLFYELFLVHGRSLTSICEELNTRGFVSPQSKNPWVPGTLRQMLKNRWTYAGYTTWGATSSNIQPNEFFRVKAEWEALITEDMAREAEKQLAARTQAPRAVSSPYLFSMVAKCALCGGNIIVKNHAGRSGCISNRYACHNRCRGSATGDPEMAADVRKLILSLQDSHIFESMTEETPDYMMALKKRYDDATKALEQVRAERKRLTLAFTRESISIDEYEEIMGELQQRQNVLAHTVAELEQTIATTPTAETRRARLEEVRDKGLQMLDHPDRKTANTWLRQHIILYIRDFKVYAREII